MSGPNKLVKYDSATFTHLRLLSDTDWIDISDEIVAAITGGLDSDPGSIGGSLTATKETDTFDGSPVDCVEFGWDTTNAIRNGYDETSNVSIATIVALFPDYDPSIHTVQLEARLVDPGTLDGTQPLVALVRAPAGTISADSRGVGFALEDSTHVTRVRALEATSCTLGATPGSNPGVSPLVHTRMIPEDAGGVSTSHAIDHQNWGGVAEARTKASTLTTIFTGADTLDLLFGQLSIDEGTISGLRIGFRIRLIATNPGLVFSDLDFGSQY